MNLNHYSTHVDGSWCPYCEKNQTDDIMSDHMPFVSVSNNKVTYKI